jgi:hypothetical protein
MADLKKPKFIKNNEKTLGVFSSLRLDFDDDSIYKFVDNRSFQVVWSEGSIVGVKTEFNKKIYKSKQGFYLYLFIGEEKKTSLIVYYKQDQYSEFTIFIQQLLKQFNNDKTTNK